MITALYSLIWLSTLVFAIMVVLSRRADHAAFNLMGVMVCLAANFLVMGFEFLGFLQVIVYVGAIMVLFLFVIMLLNLRKPEAYVLSRLTPLQFFGAAAGLLMLVLMVGRFGGASITPPTAGEILVASPPTGMGATQTFATELLEIWIIPFEVSSLLLLSAVIGAIVIARRRDILIIDTSSQTPATASPAPAPAPASPKSSH